MDALCERPRVVAIGGPTATGKTSLSVALAKAFDGEIINADSMQIYRELSVGTAKATPEERQGIPHHLLDFLPPEQPYSVADFVSAASDLVQQISARKHLPLVVGGTGLYITSLLNGVSFAPEQNDPALRQRLQQEAQTQGTEALYARLQAIDPAYAGKVHPNNLPRVIRALELYELTGRKMSEQQQSSRPAQPPYRSLCLCLTCRDRALLYKRIDQRVDQMVASGVLAEAELVWKTGTATAQRHRPSGIRSSSRISQGNRRWRNVLHGSNRPHVSTPSGSLPGSAIRMMRSGSISMKRTP